MKDQLATALNSRGLLFQFHTITPLANAIRVAFDFLDPASVENLESNPIVINHRVLPVFRPRFIVPEFGYDIAITGCGGIQGFQGGMDAVVRNAIGPRSIIRSRMELNGDAYIVVMDSFENTVRLLDTDLPLPRGVPPYVTISKPMYLFFFNLRGCPASPTYLQSQNSTSTSADIQNLQRQVDLLRENGVQTVQSVQNVFNVQNQSLVGINTSINVLQNAFAMSVASQTGLHRLTMADNELTRLRAERSSKELFLLMAPNDGVRAQVNNQIAALDRAIQLQDKLRGEANVYYTSLTDRMATFTLTSSTDGHPPPPHQHPEDEEDDRPHQRRRLEPVDGNNAPPMDQSVSISSVPHVSPCNVASSAPTISEPAQPPSRKLRTHGRDMGVDTCLSSSSSPCTTNTCSIPLLFHLFLFFCFFSSVSANVSQSFRTVSVNANGFADVMKHSALSNIVSTHRPHAWLIAETKSQSSVRSRINIRDYKVFESPGVKADKTTSKWGVALGVTASLHSQIVPLPPQMAGRAVCVDIVIPSDSGRGFPHRLMGVYAPYDPGGTSNPHDSLHDFWDCVYDICATAQHSWQVIGDFNATLTSSEVMGDATGDNQARTLYRHFLQRSHGIDTWEVQNDNNAHHVCTYSAYNGCCRSIIDRCFNATSSLTSACSQDRSPYPPRFIVPKRHESHRFRTFADRVDCLAREAQLHEHAITDDSKYQLRWQALTDIFLTAGTEAFDLPRTYDHSHQKIVTPTITIILREYSRLNRLLSALKRQTLPQLCARNRWTGTYLQALSGHPFLHPILSPPSLFYSPSSLLFYRKARSALSKLRYRAEKDERRLRSTRTEKSRLNRCLLGGSAKCLYPPSQFQGPPPAISISDPHNQNVRTYLTSADDVKTQTMDYFSALYHRNDRPDPPKPWMDCPSVRSIRENLRCDSFQWPQKMDLPGARALIRKGNPRPAPGPDRWEKWMVKSLHDFSFQLVVDLWNYCIESSHFPSCVKPSSISLIHKRGDATDLANFRGICTNLTSFLAQLETWADRTKTPLYTIRRDQKKGFDRLEPQGFYDAIMAYGLPSSIIDFDVSAQSDVP
ncbi:hypothetical protein EDD85DRAFT_776432, partial [Armillaria nabsnona]